MEFICLSSGSSGNAYVLKHNERCILVECGIRYSKLLDKLAENNLSITDIKGAVITHSHKDHCIAKEQLKKQNIVVFEPYECDLPFTFMIDVWVVYCFRVQHDVFACGFIFINTITKETMLFINDTYYIELEDKVKNLKYDYVAIECNHVYNKLLNLLKDADQYKQWKLNRQRHWHLSLINTKKMLNQLCLKDTKKVYLMHLSQEAGDPDKMKKTISNTFNIETLVCKKDGGFY